MAIESRIISTIREYILAECAGVGDSNEYDKWDEYQNGVNWLDNELGLFEKLCGYGSEWFQHITTVQQAMLLLRNKPDEYKKLLLIFAQLGGTNNEVLFNMSRTEDDIDNNDYLNTRQ